MSRIHVPFAFLACVSASTLLLVGCRDDSQSPPSRPEPPAGEDAPAGSMLAPIDLVYICGNTFLATNSTAKAVTVVYRVVGTDESAGLTLRPAVGDDQGHSETERQDGRGRDGRAVRG